MSAFRDKIERILRSYRCQHTQDDSGSGSQLVDVFTPIDHADIGAGKEEVHLLADCLAYELALPDTRAEALDKEHWVFAAAEACRPHVMLISDGRTEWARDHLLKMLDEIRDGGMSATKACRWLGWVQACMCFAGINTLADVKDINRAASGGMSPLLSKEEK